MKNIISIVFILLLSLGVKSQVTTMNIDVTRKQLKDATKLSDLVAGVSPDCAVKRCKFAMVVAGKVTEFYINGHFMALPNDIKKLEKVYVQEIKSDCKEITNMKYIFTVKKD